MLQVNNGRTDTPIRVRLVVHALVFDPGPPRLARYVSERASPLDQALSACRPQPFRSTGGGLGCGRIYLRSERSDTDGGRCDQLGPACHACRRLRPERRRPTLRCNGLCDTTAQGGTRSHWPVAVRLWIASDSPDTDFTAKLIDVYPPSADYPHGFAINLTEGVFRVRYRDSWERPALMVPGRARFMRSRSSCFQSPI
jgi:X-Pro dipeptidyl-peptidase C-terminal non-catalytic domain